MSPAVIMFFIIFLLIYAVPVAYKASRDGTPYMKHIILLMVSNVAALVSSRYIESDNYLNTYIILNYVYTIIVYLLFTTTGRCVLVGLIVFNMIDKFLDSFRR